MKKMEKSMKLFISIVLVSLICLFAVNVSFATDESSLEKEIYYVVANNSKTSTKIKISKVDGENYLFLPSSADLSNLVLNCTKINTSISLKKSNGDEILIKSGEAFDFTSFYGSKPLDGIYSVKVIVKEYVGEDLPANIEDLKDIEPSSTQEMSLNIMKSSNIDSMFIQSANAETAGRDYIEASEDHSAKANGKVALVQEDGSFIYDGTLKEIKGRGNSTWRESDKKPYQIKLDKKADLINPEDGSNAGKKWVLLANSMDPSMLRNKITYDLGKELGLLNTPDCKTIDLYYDGEYRGTYLLSEKVEISKTVVNINDLESEIEDANDGVDLDTLETAKGTDKYGNEYQYVVGIKNPENITGGYLLEIDDAYYASEKSWFTTISGKHYVVKSPEYLSKEGIEYISNIINEIEICINNNGINPDTNKKLEDYIDIDSFAKYILVQELTKNSDAYISSTYMYKDKDDDKIYAGALWDFDTAYGIRTNPSYLSDAESLLLKFNFESVDSFKIKMNEIYKSEVYPLVKNILLGNTSGKYLRNINDYVSEINDSQRMNYTIWNFYDINQKSYNSYKESISDFKNFISSRTDYLKDEINERADRINASLILFDQYIFDSYYYSNKYPDLQAVLGNDAEKLFEHYITYGIKEGRQASALFNPEYYLARYEDLYNAFTGSDKYMLALQHFINYGMNEGRIGSAEFDINVYKATSEDLVQAFGNNNKLYYEHYLRYGYNENRIIKINKQLVNGIFFDAKYYADKYSDLKKTYGYDENALFEHYITFGIKEGRQASAIFNPVHYLKCNSDLSKAFIDEDKYEKAVLHFLNYGIQEGRTGSYEFDINTYKTYEDLYNAFKDDNDSYYKHYLKYGIKEGRIANGNLVITNEEFFNAEYYSNKYPDLKEYYGMDYDSLYEHFKVFGIKEGRQASPVFNAEYYLEKYEDLKLTFKGENKYADAYNHFLTYGINEGRQASTEFNVIAYKAKYKDLQNAYGEKLSNYYVHYLIYGMAEGRTCI